MSNRVTAILLAGMLAIMSSSAWAAAAGAPKPEKAAAPARSLDLQQLIAQFSARRDAVLANRQALINQLKTATAAQRTEILAKMESEQKDIIAAQRALGKQIRDQMRRLRETAPGSRRGL